MMVCRRLSPACAGNGTRTLRTPTCSTAQPRVRGERAACCLTVCVGVGSAPRARGTGYDPSRHVETVRLSPACAGNGRCAKCPRPSPAAQPRVRGERAMSRLVSPPDPGSAPRARGTAGQPRGVDENHRLSPACAGNGPLAFSVAMSASAQPRVRGERTRVTPRGVRRAGSAPRARGTADRIRGR